jgi:MFS family permease
MLSVRPERRVPGTYRSLLAAPAFRRLMPVFSLSDIGDGMTAVAVPWLALAIGPEDGRGALAGIALAAYLLPGALGAVALGRWMRRLSAQRILVSDSALRAVLLGVIPVAHATGALTPATYVGLLGSSSLLHAWGKAGKYALFAPVFSEDQRLAANGALSLSLWTSTIVGPALAGLLTGVASPAWIIGLDAATFAVLALQVLRTRLSPAAGAVLEAGAKRGGLRFLRHQPELLGLLTVTWMFNFAFGPVEVALAVFVRSDLHAGPGLLGTYWASFGIGAVVGTLALALVHRKPLWPAIIAIVAGHGIALLPFAFSGTAMPSLISFTLAGIIYGPYSALSMTLLQNRTPSASLTTVMAARNAIILTASPLGAALGGVLVDRTSAPVILVSSGILMILIAAISASLLIIAKYRA